MDFAKHSPGAAAVALRRENVQFTQEAGAVALHIIAHRKRPMHLGPRELRTAGPWYWVAFVALTIAALAPWV